METFQVDNRVLDRKGNLFVAIVEWDFDWGWMCAEWHDGEYEENIVGGYGDCDECRKAALREGLDIAKRRSGRVLHSYESPHEITKKLEGYRESVCVDCCIGGPY
jgi:hypothetical protein